MMKRSILWMALLVALLATGFAFTQGNAQKPTPSDNEVNAVARQLYCPVCENIPLDVCPTTVCARWREVIRSKLAEGKNTQQINEYFAQQYGDRVLSVPPMRGFNFILYVLPPLIVVAGAIAVYLVLKRMRRKPEPQPEASTAPPPDEEYLRRIEDELNQRGAG